MWVEPEMTMDLKYAAMWLFRKDHNGVVRVRRRKKWLNMHGKYTTPVEPNHASECLPLAHVRYDHLYWSRKAWKRYRAIEATLRLRKVPGIIDQ
jgi:hypothetical protein